MSAITDFKIVSMSQPDTSEIRVKSTREKRDLRDQEMTKMASETIDKMIETGNIKSFTIKNVTGGLSFNVAEPEKKSKRKCTIL